MANQVHKQRRRNGDTEGKQNVKNERRETTWRHLRRDRNPDTAQKAYRGKDGENNKENVVITAQNIVRNLIRPLRRLIHFYSMETIFFVRLTPYCFSERWGG
jgi:hypothetical protein